MSGRFRTSKYRHVQGSLTKKELWYPDIRPDTTSADANTIAASARFLAVAWATTGGGSVGILPLGVVGKRKESDLPLLQGHSGKIQDIQFCPFNDSLLATAADDGTARIWEIPEGGLRENTSTSLATLKGHKRAVSTIQFHPTASGVVATGSADKTFKIWDLAAPDAPRVVLDEAATGEGVWSLAWNYDGSLLALLAKDKKLKLVDPRVGAVVQSGDAFPGVKPANAVWLGNSPRLVVTGFSQSRERRFGVWDTTDLSKPLTATTVDSSTGVLQPFFDPDAGLLYLAGKGDGNIRVYEIADAAPWVSEITTVASDVPQKAATLVPKRGLDVLECEVGRVLKLTANAVAPVSFVVPRKTHMKFHEDLFPETAAPVAALSAADWFAGQNKPPVLMSLDPAVRGTVSTSTSTASAEPAPAASTVSTSSSPASSASASPSSAGPLRSSGSSNRASSTPSPSASASASSEPGTRVIEVEVKGLRGSGNIVRASKYRHLNATPTMQKDWIDNAKPGPTGNDTEAIKASATGGAVAVPWAGNGGPLAVLPLSFHGRLPDKIPVIETASVILDYAFHPFDESLVVTGTEDAHARIWKLPNGGLLAARENLREPAVDLRGHTKKVSTTAFHPLARDVLLTAALDFSLRLWDVEAGSEHTAIRDAFSDSVTSVTFNYDGSTIAFAARDKKIRLYDPRANRVTSEADGHTGPKGMRLAWLGTREQLFSVGITRSSERECMVWDVRNMVKPIVTKPIDQGSGALVPFYDGDTGVMFLAAVGDGSLKFFEINDEDPYVHYCTQYMGTPQMGMSMLPKRLVDVASVEIARFVKLTARNSIETIKVTVPRTRTEYFQDDIYVPTFDGRPVSTAAEWFSGVNRPPGLMSLQPPGMKPLSEAPKIVHTRKVVVDEKGKEQGFADIFDAKAKTLTAFYDRVTVFKEDEHSKVNQGDGVDDSEWDE